MRRAQMCQEQDVRVAGMTSLPSAERPYACQVRSPQWRACAAVAAGSAWGQGGAATPTAPPT
eukprot:7755339-Alexandrium_andersonii.AAC.1